MAKVEVYFTAFCPYCVMAKRLLEKKGIEYISLDMNAKPELFEEMMQRSKRRSVPQIIINDIPVGGYDDIAALEMTGQLDKMLAEQ